MKMVSLEKGKSEDDVLREIEKEMGTTESNQELFLTEVLGRPIKKNHYPVPRQRLLSSERVMTKGERF